MVLGERGQSSCLETKLRVNALNASLGKTMTQVASKKPESFFPLKCVPWTEVAIIVTTDRRNIRKLLWVSLKLNHGLLVSFG